MTTPRTHDQIRSLVREHYGAIAQSPSAGGCCNPGGSGAIGYSASEQGAVPEGTDLGLGCGNPHAIAVLQPGQTVLDLGSGAGFDCFLAARAVGDTGRVIGVDMTPAMISRARQAASTAGVHNVEFRLGEIEHLPLADGSVDAILSNCVINLSPDKAAVFHEAFRVLKPGGRLALSDMVQLKPLPEALLGHAEALAGCVAGAATVATLQQHLLHAGFGDVLLTVRAESRAAIAAWLPGSGIEDYVASATIMATRPQAGVATHAPRVLAAPPAAPQSAAATPLTGAAPAAVSPCCAPTCCGGPA